jgi:hypothetical protein
MYRPQRRGGWFEDKNFLPLRDIETGFLSCPSCSVTTIASVLSQRYYVRLRQLNIWNFALTCSDFYTSIFLPCWEC